MTDAPKPAADGFRYYHKWAGNNRGTKEDKTRCICEVRERSSNWPRYFQCARKRGFGPDGLYCKQHDPAAQAARDAIADEKSKASTLKWRKEIRAVKMFDIIQQIADGHNDARGLAADFIKKFNS